MKLGIVGLPNVGKSTLFNSLTKAGAESANYPFCTIDPNVGVVTVPDDRLKALGEMYHSKKVTPAVIEFVDIAGLVKGASKGEGLGNQFLSNIREVDAIVHVVRCFEDPNVIHVDGSVNPLRDIETINLELIFSDIEILDRRISKIAKQAKMDKTYAKELELLEAVKAHLKELGLEYIDFGTHSTDSVDYPDMAVPACDAVVSGECSKALLFCGTGVGISMAANKIKGIRACCCSDSFSCEYTRRHNDANALCMGGRVVGAGLACQLVDLFLNTEFEGGRHQRRIDKLTALENR